MRPACFGAPASPDRAFARRGAWIGIGGTAAACLCVATASVASKRLLEHAPPLPVAFVQIASSTAVVWTAAAGLGRLPRRRAHLRLALPGVLQPGLAYTLSFLGLAITPVTVAGFLFAFEAAIVALLAWPLLGERPTAAVVLSIGLGTAGLVLLALTGGGGVEAPLPGVGLILAGVLCASLDTVASRALMFEADALTMTAAGHVAGLLVIGAALLVSGPQPWAFVHDGSTLAVAAASGVLLHGAATFLFNIALSRISASRAAALFPLISLLTALGGLVFLRERIAPPQVLGGAVILLSAVAVSRSRPTS